MEINMAIVEKFGLLGAIAILAFKLYVSKDAQQNEQNDLLVQNLMESNRKKDELLERTVIKFEETMNTINSSIRNVDARIERIEQKIS